VTDQRGVSLLTSKHNKAVTQRQVEVLCLLARGLTSQAVAQHLMISEHTVIRHISNMMSCFGAGNRMELLALAIVSGIVDSTHWPPRPTGRLSLEILGSLPALPDGAISRH
jgi:DNA-binding NarL/FixJ family response regulator